MVLLLFKFEPSLEMKVYINYILPWSNPIPKMEMMETKLGPNLPEIGQFVRILLETKVCWYNFNMTHMALYELGVGSWWLSEL